MYLKNVGFTYKSQILKFKIQQHCNTKRCGMIHLNVPDFLHIFHFRSYILETIQLIKLNVYSLS